MNSSSDQEPPQTPLRIIQVDRKIANQLGDVSNDLKLLLVKQMKEKSQKKPVQPSQSRP
jgi:hypothetical protein